MKPLGNPQDASTLTTLNSDLTWLTENLLLWCSQSWLKIRTPSWTLTSALVFIWTSPAAQMITLWLLCKTRPLQHCPGINFHCKLINKAHCQTETQVTVSQDQLGEGHNPCHLCFLDCPSPLGQPLRGLHPSTHSALQRHLMLLPSFPGHEGEFHGSEAPSTLALPRFIKPLLETFFPFSCTEELI